MHMSGGHSTAGGGVVDDVVMYQGAGVQQLQSGEQPQNLLAYWVVGSGGHRPVAPVGESRAQPFAAAEDEVLENGDQPVVFGADVGRTGTAIGQVDPELIGDAAGEIGSRWCCHFGIEPDVGIQRPAPSSCSAPTNRGDDRSRSRQARKPIMPAASKAVTPSQVAAVVKDLVLGSV